MAAIPPGHAARPGAVAALMAALGCAAAGLHAQPANPFVGSWQATFLVATNRGLMDERQAELVITPTGGTWQARSQGRHDPCTGREVPLVLDEVTDTRLAATVRYSTLGDFCKDLKLVLEKDATGKVVGRRGKTELTLERR